METKKNNFSALLLAAGYGKRLHPLTKYIPKCLVPVMGRPILDFWITMLTKFDNLETIYINTHYLTNQVESFVQKHKYRKKIQLIHEEELLGTAATLVKLLPSIDSHNIFVAHADNLSIFNAKNFFDFHLRKENRHPITLLSFKTDDPKSCGIIDVNTDGVLVNFFEKMENPPSDLANGAVYIINCDCFQEIVNLGNISDISLDMIPKFIGRINVWHNSCYHRDIGTLDSYAVALRDFAVYSDEMNYLNQFKVEEF